MKDKLKKYIKEIVVFVVLLAIATNGISYYKSLELNKESLSIESFTLLDGSIYTLPKDKPIIIHFWATWCPVCKVEAPNIQELSKENEVITIAVQSKSKENIQKYMEENNLSFKVVNDLSGFYAREFNIKVFPTTLIYDSNKNQKFSEVGYTSTFGFYLRMFLTN